MKRFLGGIIFLIPYSLFLLFLCLFSPLFSQFSQGLVVGADYHYGRFIRHSISQTFPVPNPTRAVSIEILRQTSGNKYWHKAHKFPRFGVGFLYKDYGNTEVLGQAYAIYPQLDFFHVKKKNFRLMSRLAFGFAYLNHPFDRLNNPQNTGIGSHFNNYATIGLATEYNITPHIIIRLGANISHSSNGHFRFPNLGINTACLQAGIHYRFAPEKVVDTLTMSCYRVSRKIRFGLRYGFGLKESNAADGPFYQMHVFSAYMLFPRSGKNQWLAGAEVSTNGDNIAWKKDNEATTTTPTTKSTDISAYGGYEVLWGKIGFVTQLHVKVNPPFDKKLWFVRLGPTYHFRNPQRCQRFNPYVGMYLKANKGVADYVEGTLGISF